MGRFQLKKHQCREIQGKWFKGKKILYHLCLKECLLGSFGAENGGVTQICCFHVLTCTTKDMHVSVHRCVYARFHHCRHSNAACVPIKWCQRVAVKHLRFITPFVGCLVKASHQTPLTSHLGQKNLMRVKESFNVSSQVTF